MGDRPGNLPDLNIIDFEELALEDLEMVYDQPAGGKRIVQRAKGSVARSRAAK